MYLNLHKYMGRVFYIHLYTKMKHDPLVTVTIILLQEYVCRVLLSYNWPLSDGHKRILFINHKIFYNKFFIHRHRKSFEKDCVSLVSCANLLLPQYKLDIRKSKCTCNSKIKTQKISAFCINLYNIMSLLKSLFSPFCKN